MRRTAFGSFLFFAFVLVLSAETYIGKGVGVHDGDTISVMKAGRAVKIRLEGIDCPELGQDFGTRAKVFTSTLVFGKDVQVKEFYRDQYGRTVARVLVADHDVSLELVKGGAGVALQAVLVGSCAGRGRGRG